MMRQPRRWAVVLWVGLLAQSAGCEPAKCKTDSDCDSSMGQLCNNGTCGAPAALDLSVVPVHDLAMKAAAGTPICSNGGQVSCTGSDKFYSSPTQSGCFPAGTMPPNPNPDPG